MSGGTRTLELPGPLDLRQTLGPLRTGRDDPTLRLEPRAAVRACLTPGGAATLHLRITDGRLEADGWGPGAPWALEGLGRLVGLDGLDGGWADSGWADSAPGAGGDAHETVERARRRRPGLRLAATGHVHDVLVPTILAQMVTGAEAHRAWAGIVRTWGRDAPGPVPGLRVPPTAAALAARPSWELPPLGVERRRARALRRACSRIERLQEAVDDPRLLRRRLLGLTGVGPWTTAIVLRHVAGDPDTVEVGDFHLANLVCWNLAGEPRGSDERMLELLRPFGGHRGRVVLLLRSAGQRAPRRGPRRRGGPLARR